MWKKAWKKVRKMVAVLLVLLVLGGGVAGYLLSRQDLPLFGTPVAPAGPNSSYAWVEAYLQWDHANLEGRIPATSERLSKGELSYVVETVLVWAEDKFESGAWEISGSTRWRGLILLELWGTPKEPTDGSAELWVIVFCWVRETNRYELVWEEMLDTEARYKGRVGGGQ